MTHTSRQEIDSSMDELRSKIDEVDGKILELINQRLQLAKDIGKIKSKNGGPILDPARESQLLERLFTLNAGPLNNHALRHIFREIIAAAREIQTPLRIGFLGPEATFTHIAAMKQFGHAGNFFPQPSIKDTFEEVEKGTCHYGVVPVENSIEGSVNHTLDLFFSSELKICGEIYYHISHDLLSKSGELSEIKVIYSHPHAFAQCRRWLRKYLPDAPHEECSSTAEAARKAGSDPRAAAIASPEAAHMYGLSAVSTGIEDTARNTTRFLVIGKSRAKPTGKDKTSIMFVTRHVPGALFKALEPLYEEGINMVKLESRPSGQENWSYMFFVDVEGHLSDPSVSETIEKMKKTCLYLKWLGSYPASDEGFGPNQGDLNLS